MPGPAPKHPSQRRRRNATVPMVQLPAEGRKGRPPTWPLADLVTELTRQLAEARELVREGEDWAKTLAAQLAKELGQAKHLVKAEKSVWKEIWNTPQAAAWERLGWTRTVARYVRLLVRSELPTVGTKIAAEVRSLEDRLGLNPMSMLRLRWEIATDELAEPRQQKRTVRRLKAVDPHAVARS